MEEGAADKGRAADSDLELLQRGMLTLPTRYGSNVTQANDRLESVLDRPEYTEDDPASTLTEVQSG
ncbi:hypothetical protein [Subtercola frigoramans]|nr:hypothetical protein [Subtercola frigoramans]